MSHLTIRTEANNGGSSPLVLPDDEFIKFTGAFNKHLVMVGLMHPTQLNQLVFRISSAGTLQRWALYIENQLVGASHPQPEGSDMDGMWSAGLTGSGENISCDADSPVADSLQRNPEIPNEQIIYTRQSVIDNEPSQLPTPASSPRKRRRRADPASTLPNSKYPATSPITSGETETLKGSPVTNKKDGTLELSARLICKNPSEMLRPLFESWQQNVKRGLHALGLPFEWKGGKAAAKYLGLIQDGMVADPVAQRVARMLLVLNYEEICEYPENYVTQPTRQGGRKASHAMDCILRAYLNKPYEETSKAERDAIHNILKQGRQLWTLAGAHGMGIVLTCDDFLMFKIKNNTIHNTRINALARHAIYRPETVDLLHSLTPEVTSLMFGQIHTGLAAAIHPSGSGVLGSAALSDIFKKDEATLTQQEMTANWRPIELKSLASKKKAETIVNEPKTRPAGPIQGLDTFATFPLDRVHPGHGDMVTYPFEDMPLADSVEFLTWEGFLNNEDLDIFSVDSLQFGKQS